MLLFFIDIVSDRGSRTLAGSWSKAMLDAPYLKYGSSSGGTRTLMDLGFPGTLLMNPFLSNLSIIW